MSIGQREICTICEVGAGYQQTRSDRECYRCGLPICVGHRWGGTHSGECFWCYFQCIPHDAVAFTDWARCSFYISVEVWDD